MQAMLSSSFAHKAKSLVAQELNDGRPKSAFAIAGAAQCG